MKQDILRHSSIDSREVGSSAEAAGPHFPQPVIQERLLLKKPNRHFRPIADGVMENASLERAITDSTIAPRPQQN